MLIEIKGIGKDKTTEAEYVEMLVYADLNLIDYAILDTTFDESGDVSNSHRHYYGFPNWEVEEGDIIQVFTKKGIDRRTPRIRKLNEPVIHKFHMGLDVDVWNDRSDYVELIKISVEDAFEFLGE